METYSYTAVAKDGKDKKGQIEAETRDEAARKLKQLTGASRMVQQRQSRALSMLLQQSSVL